MSEKHGVMYFQPGQLLFHAQGSLQGTENIQKLINWANGLAAPRGISLSASDDVLDFNTGEEGPFIKKQRSISAGQTKTPPIVVGPQRPYPEYPQPSYKSPPVKIPPPFSLLFANVKSSSWPEKLPTPPSDDVVVDDDMYPDSEPVEKHIQAMKELLDLAHFLDKNRGSAPVKLEVVSLNWSTSLGKDSQPGGTGGPGGEPQHVNNADIGKYHIFPTSASTLPAAFSTVSQPGAGNGVVVAMLDTAYEPAELTAIYNKWVRDVKPPQTPHPILEALLGANGCLTVHNDPEARDYLPGFRIDGYDYVMNSHGLHGAGTINSLAPGAEIHLYQVLNKYGMGDTRIIGKNMARIINELGGRPLVVNASLTFRIPQDEGQLQDNDEHGMGQFILSYRPSFLMRLICWIVCWIFESLLRLPCPGFCASWLDRQALPFEWICDLVYGLNSRVIAAAGNDGRMGRTRPPARFPAASESVVGVGALGNNGAPAPYSNLADQPPFTGITTLGGDATKGILGVYADPFPDGRPNDNGWGRWHGTSFATDVISGVTAAVLGSLINANPTAPTPRTEDAIAALYNAQSSRTRATEDVFSVEQR